MNWTFLSCLEVSGLSRSALSPWYHVKAWPHVAHWHRGACALLSLWWAVQLSLTRRIKEFLTPVSHLRTQLLCMLLWICGIITSCKCGTIFECWFYGRFEALGTYNVAVIEKWFRKSSWADEERCDSGLKKKKKAILSLCCLLCYLRWKKEYKW